MTTVPINNAGADPLQSQDVDVFLLDQATGEEALIGRFVSFMATVRNATRPYNTVNSRIPRLLDGTLTFEWTLQRGMLDTRVVEKTFGYAIDEGNTGARARMTRRDRISRHPRFSLAIDLNPEELENGEDENGSDGSGRTAQGRYILSWCKTEVLTFGADGSNNGIVPVQWEGMAEGIYFDDQATEFSASTTNEEVESGGAGDPGEELDGNSSTDNIESSLSQFAGNVSPSSELN